MVATSNRAPENLYEDGLNRSLLLPFIAMLKHRCEVWPLGGAQDYRMLGSKEGGETRKVFFTDLADFQASREATTGGRKLETHVIPVAMGRQLVVTAIPSETLKEGLIVSSTFPQLCEAKIGAADYHALCRVSKIIFLEGLRPFRLSELDFARRFITLIDLAYESGTRIIISSNATIDEVFAEIVEAEQKRRKRQQGGLQMNVRKGGGSSSSMMSTFVSGDTEWSATGLEGASLATGGAGETDVGFAIGRAVSRLHEMGSPVYGQMD